jgi:hypothetical protein
VHVILWRNAARIALGAGDVCVIDAGERVTRTCVVFINATTHPDPLCPTSVGSTLQQQGEGGGGEGQ